MPTDGMNQDQNGQGNEQGAGAGGAGAGAGGAGNAGAGADGGAAQNAGAGNAAAAGEGKQPGNDGGNAGNGAAGQGGQQGGTQGEGGAQKEGGQAQGAGAEPWAKIEDEAVRTVAQGKSYEQLAKELHGAQSLIGKKSVGIPNKDSKPEEWAAFHKARGVPDAVDGYNFDATKEAVLEGIPKDVIESPDGWNDAEEKRFRELAKQSNLSDREANELLRRELEHRKAGLMESSKAHREAARVVTDHITEKYGPKAEGATQDASVAAKHLGFDEDVVSVINSAKGSSGEARAKTFDFLVDMGRRLGEGGQPGNAGGSTTALSAKGMTADQARNAKEAYLNQGDNRAAYNDSTHPNYQAVTRQVTEYLKVERGIKS